MRRIYSKNKTLIISILIIFVFCLTVGYSAFQTNLIINTKGNIKNLKEEVDSRVPKNNLLSWFEVDNPDNTNTALKNKVSGGTDGILNNFDNTTSSGYNNGELIFDGIDDFVDIGYANYDFKSSGISYVIYFKINLLKTETEQEIFGNWEGAGGGLEIKENKLMLSLVENSDNSGKYYYDEIYGNNADINKYYVLIGTYNGNTGVIYEDGKFINSCFNNSYYNSPVPIYIGTNPSSNGDIFHPSNISIKEAMLYNRALTQDEVTTITNGFKKKYE